MKKRAFALLGLISVACVALFMSGCKGDTETEYNIYYTDKTRSELVKDTFKTDIKETDLLIDEIINQMNRKTKSNEKQVIKPDNVEICKKTVENNVVYVYFSSSYNEISNSDQALLRAAIVKELTQLDQIEFVHFYVDGLDIIMENGKVLGNLSEDDFIEDANEVIGNVEWKDINLYFSNKTGDKLVKSNVSVACSKNTLMEKIIVEKLIKGPTDSNCMATLPQDTKLLSVSISSGTCYVNLNSSFLTEMVNVSNELPIYSIVNSLCELDNVNSVKIMINGDSNNVFHESINLDTTFSYNAGIMEEQE